MTVKSSSVGSLRFERLSRESHRPSSTCGAVSRSPLHQRQERGVDGVSLLKLVGVLTQEEVTGLDKLGQDQSEDFSEVETGDHLLEGLLARLVGRLVDDDVVLGSG